MKCIVCGNQKREKFIQYFSLRDIFKCQVCGFIFDDRKGGNKEDYSIKENYLERLTKGMKKARIRNCKSRLRYIRKYLKPWMSILDIGCHEGIFLKLTQDRGCRSWGLEPNYEMVRHAKDLGLMVEQGLIEDFSTNRKFDMVTLFHVLEHLEEPDKALEKIKILLKPKGYLILELPNIESYLSKKTKANWPLINSEHYSYFSPKTITQLLKLKGFEVRKISKRQFDEWNTNIKESLSRLGIIKPRVKKENEFIGPEIIKEKLNFNVMKIILTPIRYLLNLLVKILKRADYILIIAQKK